MHKVKLVFIGEARNPLTFKTPVLTVLPVRYNNQKNRSMDSEFFGDQFFDEFPNYPTLWVIRPPTGPLKSDNLDSTVSKFQIREFLMWWYIVRSKL